MLLLRQSAKNEMLSYRLAFLAVEELSEYLKHSAVSAQDSDRILYASLVAT